MQKDKNKSVDYRLKFLFTQAVTCVVLLLVLLTLRLCNIKGQQKAEEWYRQNFGQHTKAETVTDTSKKDEYSSVISTVSDENSKAVKTAFDLSKTQSVATTVNSGINSLIWPVNEGTLTSSFGYRNDPFTNKKDFHKGIDIGVSMGTRVLAAADGRVIRVGYEKNGYGNFVLLEHSSGFVTMYAHCSEILVNVGDLVKQGDAVAHSGSSGRSTGPHLHFEVRLHNTLLNPVWILPINDAV